MLTARGKAINHGHPGAPSINRVLPLKLLSIPARNNTVKHAAIPPMRRPMYLRIFVFNTFGRAGVSAQ